MHTFQLLYCLFLSLVHSFPLRSSQAIKQAAAYHRYDRTQSLAAQYDSDRISKNGFKRPAPHIAQHSILRRRHFAGTDAYTGLGKQTKQAWRSPILGVVRRVFVSQSSDTVPDVLLANRRPLTHRDWKDYQISSGWSGKALEEAQVVFQQDWDIGDMLDVAPAELDILEGMVDAAKEVETHVFEPAIEETSGSLYDLVILVTANIRKEDLERGRVKNQVLYLYGQCLASRIRLAQINSFVDGHHSTEAKLERLKLADLEAALEDVVHRDRQNDGQRSVSVFHMMHT